MGMNWLFKPTTDLPSRAAKRLSSFISPNSEVGSPFRGFLSGAVEGAGNVLSESTSPLSLAGMAIGATPWMRGAKGLTSLGRLAERQLPIGTGIGPSSLPAEMIPRGAESIYNTARSANIARNAPNLEDIAYEGARNAGKMRMPFGENIDVAKMMESLARARGR